MRRGNRFLPSVLQFLELKLHSTPVRDFIVLEDSDFQARDEQTLNLVRGLTTTRNRTDKYVNKIKVVNPLCRIRLHINAIRPLTMRKTHTNII